MRSAVNRVGLTVKVTFWASSQTRSYLLNPLVCQYVRSSLRNSLREQCLKSKSKDLKVCSPVPNTEQSEQSHGTGCHGNGQSNESWSCENNES